jgi:hypothetical protein
MQMASIAKNIASTEKQTDSSMLIIVFLSTFPNVNKQEYPRENQREKGEHKEPKSVVYGVHKL